MDLNGYKILPCDAKGNEITMSKLKTLQATDPNKLYMKKFIVYKNGEKVAEFDTHSEAQAFIRQRDREAEGKKTYSKKNKGR